MNCQAKKALPVVLLISFIYGCKLSSNSPERETSSVALPVKSEIKTGGFRVISVVGKYNIGKKRIGDGKIKVLLLHGGQGFSHDYFEGFEDMNLNRKKKMQAFSK